MVAVFFDQLGNEAGTRFFNKMSTASYGGERDQGHTGNFFHHLGHARHLSGWTLRHRSLDARLRGLVF